jgi:hypothetical protein
MTPPLWLWPNLLSLDAPLVAVVWQALIARSFGVPLRPAAGVILFLTVWAIYLADRLLDTRKPAASAEPLRHQFYRLYRTPALTLFLAVLIADVVLTLTWLRPAVFHNGLYALGGVSLYLAMVHWTGFELPKELVVSGLFSAGTFLVPLTNVAAAREMLLPATCFFLLCLANVVAIETWEWRELRRGQQPAPHPITQSLGRYYYYWTAPLVLLCGYASAPLYAAAARGFLGLVMLRILGTYASLNLRRVLADAVLLTPVFFR